MTARDPRARLAALVAAARLAMLAQGHEANLDATQMRGGQHLLRCLRCRDGVFISVGHGRIEGAALTQACTIPSGMRREEVLERFGRFGARVERLMRVVDMGDRPGRWEDAHDYLVSEDAEWLLARGADGAIRDAIGKGG